MKILIVDNSKIPVSLYGGTERVIWSLGKELVKLQHQVGYLVKAGSSCDFATVHPIDEQKELLAQIPEEYDIVHFNFTPPGVRRLQKPYIITIHGNINHLQDLDLNSVFVSGNHASRHGSDSYVHNGLDWDEYVKPDLDARRTYFHFLGKAAWRLKNVKGAIDIIKQTPSEKLRVLGGVRFNIKMGLRFTFSPRIRFYGMVGGEKKDRLLNGSKGLVFPVRWHEPFGLALIESLYFGCPVFGTPYGSLPEIVNAETGFLSNKTEELVRAVCHAGDFSAGRCHEYARESFNSKKMARSYLEKYETVRSGRTLNRIAPRLIALQQEKFLEWQ